MLAFLRKRRLILYFSGRFYRGDGTCSARFLPSYSFHLYAFIFIKGILLLSILCFNSLSRRGGKQPFRRLFGRIALFHIFFLTFAMRLPTRSSPVFMIKKSCIDKCRCKIFGRGDGTCSARFLPSYSFHLYAFIFIKGILLLSILCFNSLSRRGGKQPFRRLFGRIALFHIFFLTFAMRLPTRSSPVFMIKKSCIDKCRCKIFGRGDGT